MIILKGYVPEISECNLFHQKSYQSAEREEL